MWYRNFFYKITAFGFLVFSFLFPTRGWTVTKTWTGFGGDTNWLNPLNWSGAALPQPADDVLLDNGELPVSYQVVLPDQAILLKTLHIYPSPGRNIELILPASNLMTDAITTSGPGYGIELNAGAIFRNASGIASGESLSISDSIMIHDGGRYIHQTRANHANSILRFLSTAPGTEQGIFDFDVPKASYTLSVSNRIYGSLELHATALGATVNYTCAGANPLLIHGNLRIGDNVNMSMNLSGTNGNILVEGDFIQEGGQLNLASGANDQTILQVKGDLYQLPRATITETNNGNPWLELKGERLQQIAMAGRILNQVGFRMNNPFGSVLNLPFTLPWKLELDQGTIFSTNSAMLTLDTNCDILADSSGLAASHIDGPLHKLGLNDRDHFLFPVGSIGDLRWLELKNATGNYTVEYIRQDPNGIGISLGPGLDHISKVEYWTVVADGLTNEGPKVELSFAASVSGGVTDPNYLNVAKFQSGQWEDGGHTAFTGNFVQGSVLSRNIDFLAREYTLASTVNLENPLPITMIDLEIKEIAKKPVFSWKIESPEIADHFDLYEVAGNQSQLFAQVNAVSLQTNYKWTWESVMKKGIHYFRICMIDVYGKEFPGKIVPFKKQGGDIHLYCQSYGIQQANVQLLIETDEPDNWNYEIIAVNGQSVKKGTLILNAGINYLKLVPETLTTGIYIFHARSSSGKTYSLSFRK